MKNKAFTHISFPAPVATARFSFRHAPFRIWLFLLSGAAAFFLCNATSTRAETWNQPAGASWITATNWNPASVPNAIGASPIFNNAASASNPAQNANRSVTADAAQTVGSILFNNDAANAFTTSLTAGTGGSLIFDETGVGPATISIPAAVGTGNYAISAPTTLTDSLVATVSNITATSASGALNLTASTSGPGGITKQGDGLATFGTGAKTYSGATVLNGGRTRISSAAQPSGTSSFTINSGAQLTLISANGNYTFGSGPLNLNGTGAVTGPFAAFPGAIRNDSGLIATISNVVVLQSDTLIHVQATAGTGGTPAPVGSLTFSQSISGPGRLTLTAPTSNVDQGSLILVASNSYAGGTLVNGGIISVSGAAATLGSGNVTVDNAAAPSAIAKLTIQAGVINAIADTATLTLAGGGTAGVADQGYVELGAGINETVGALRLGGVTQASGTYGSTLSTAAVQNNEYFAGTGIITVLAVAAQPALAITLNTPNVVVSWPTNFTGFVLQELPAFLATNVWTDVTMPVVVTGTNNTVTVNASSGNKFFRLKK